MCGIPVATQNHFSCALFILAQTNPYDFDEKVLEASPS